jgi:hypothetical protein
VLSCNNRRRPCWRLSLLHPTKREPRRTTGRRPHRRRGACACCSTRASWLRGRSSFLEDGPSSCPGRLSLASERERREML